MRQAQQTFPIAQQFPDTMNVIAFSLLLSKFTVRSIIYGGFPEYYIFFSLLLLLYCCVATQYYYMILFNEHTNACMYTYRYTHRVKKASKLIGYVQHVIFQWDNRARSVFSLSLLLLYCLHHLFNNVERKSRCLFEKRLRPKHGKQNEYPVCILMLSTFTLDRVCFL